jgi:hypothetical protein
MEGWLSDQSSISSVFFPSVNNWSKDEGLGTNLAYILPIISFYYDL